MPMPKQRATEDDYWNLPEGQRAELIDGELWDLAAPSRIHQYIQGELTRIFGNHIRAQGGSCQVYPAPFAVDLFRDGTDIVEPDASVICDRSKLTDRGCKGAPDLVVEIVSPSSRGMDYQTKQALYTSAGVREYLIVDPSMARTTVTRTDEDPAPLIYPFSAPVPVGVLPGLELNLADIVARA